MLLSILASDNFGADFEEDFIIQNNSTKPYKNGPLSKPTDYDDNKKGEVIPDDHDKTAYNSLGYKIEK